MLLPIGLIQHAVGGTRPIVGLGEGKTAMQGWLLGVEASALQRLCQLGP